MVVRFSLWALTKTYYVLGTESVGGNPRPGPGAVAVNDSAPDGPTCATEAGKTGSGLSWLVTVRGAADTPEVLPQPGSSLPFGVINSFC